MPSPNTPSPRAAIQDWLLHTEETRKAQGHELSSTDKHKSRRKHCEHRHRNVEDSRLRTPQGQQRIETTVGDGVRGEVGESYSMDTRVLLVPTYIRDKKTPICLLPSGTGLVMVLSGWDYVRHFALLMVTRNDRPRKMLPFSNQNENGVALGKAPVFDRVPGGARWWTNVTITT
jgi:hypothetical protein